MPEGNDISRSDASAHVRTNAGSAAVAALLMIYFGFFSLAEPTGSGMFERSALVFYHTLRIGGLAMGVLAVWSLTGQRPVLVVDAVISVAIGTSFISTGLAMMVDGGSVMQSALNAVFGTMFISAGVRNWRSYFHLAAPRTRPSDHDATIESRGREMNTGGRGSPAARVYHHEASSTPASSSSANPTPPAIPQPDPRLLSTDDTPAGEPQAAADATQGDEFDDGASSDGFLASFADEDPPPRI